MYTNTAINSVNVDDLLFNKRLTENHVSLLMRFLWRNSSFIDVFSLPPLPLIILGKITKSRIIYLIMYDQSIIGGIIFKVNRN